jgi:hypothetical protein
MFGLFNKKPGIGDTAIQLADVTPDRFISTLQEYGLIKIDRVSSFDFVGAPDWRVWNASSHYLMFRFMPRMADVVTARNPQPIPYTNKDISAVGIACVRSMGKAFNMVHHESMSLDQLQSSLNTDTTPLIVNPISEHEDDANNFVDSERAKSGWGGTISSTISVMSKQMKEPYEIQEYYESSLYKDIESGYL